MLDFQCFVASERRHLATKTDLKIHIYPEALDVKLTCQVVVNSTSDIGNGHGCIICVAFKFESIVCNHGYNMNFIFQKLYHYE